MNKYDKNLPLDKMLQDYCKVNPPYKFTVELEEPNMKPGRTKIFTAVACASLVLVCAVAFIAGFGNNFFTNSTYDDSGFIINARAEGESEDNAEMLSVEKTKINKEFPLVDKSYAETKSALAFQHIALEITGDDVVSYDIKAERGTLHFRDELHRLGEKSVIEGGRFFDYFVVGAELYDLPAYTEDTYLFWLPDYESINIDASTFEAQCELLQAAEDYNKYFGDTITLTVEYEDGTKKSASIEISFDDEAYVYARMTANDDNINMY